MKYTLLSFLLLLLFSCSNSGHQKFPLLVRADSLIKKGHSDSALIVLENISLGELNTSASQAKYALLLTQARDKNYITHTDDSLIRVAVDYYDSFGDLASRAKAHYYWGRVCQDMDSVNATVREFLTAIPLAEKINDYSLLCLLYGNLGYLYRVNGLLEEADSLYLKEIKLAEIHKDSLHWALGLSNRGKVYMEKGKEYYFESEKCLKLAYTIIENMSQSTIYVKKEIMSSLAFLYERTNRPLEAISIIKSKQTLQVDTGDLYKDFILLASAYFKIGDYDHATFYLNKCLFTGNYGVKEGAYMRLADIARIEGRDKDALFYENCRMAYKDSVRLQEEPVKIVSLSKDLVHAQIAHQYKSSLNHSYYYLSVLGVLACALCVFVICYRKKEKRKVISLLSDYESVSDQLECMAKSFQEKESVIQTMQERNFADRKQINYCLTAVLEDRRTLQAEMEKKLEEKIKIIEELSKRNFNAIIDETSIYKKIRGVRKENKKNSTDRQKLTDSDWDDLKKEFCRLLPDFIPSLESQYEQLNQNDIRFLCLIKMGIGYQDMQYIFCCSVATIYSRERTVKSRMKLEGDVKLKEFLEDFP